MTALLIDPNVVALVIAIVVVGALLALLALLTLDPAASDRAALERAKTDAMHRFLERLPYDHRTLVPPKSAHQQQARPTNHSAAARTRT